MPALRQCQCPQACEAVLSAGVRRYLDAAGLCAQTVTQALLVCCEHPGGEARELCLALGKTGVAGVQPQVLLSLVLVYAVLAGMSS